MVWLGVRCWKERIAVLAVDDGPGGPSVVFRRRQNCPKGLEPGARAAWFARVAAEAVEESGCGGVAVRIADSNCEQLRCEAEGAVLAGASAAGLRTITLRRQSLIKPLSVPKGAGSWKAFQAQDPFIGSLIGDEKDAAMASLGAARH